jgi:hypothetical protein
MPGRDGTGPTGMGPCGSACKKKRGGKDSPGAGKKERDKGKARR